MNWSFSVPDLSGVSIRLFEPGDEDSAFGIIRAIGRERLGQDLRGWDDNFRATGGLLWTATFGDAVVGFAGQTDHEDFILFHSDIVHPDAQGLGIGTALVLARIATTVFAKETQVGLLATEYSQGFYERFGFRKSGEGQEDHAAKIHLFPMNRLFSDTDGDNAWRILDSSGVRVNLDESGQTG